MEENLNNNAENTIENLSLLLAEEYKKATEKLRAKKQKLLSEVNLKCISFDDAKAEYLAFKAKEKTRLNLIEYVAKKSFKTWEESSKEFISDKRRNGLIKKASDYFVEHFINTEHFSERNLKVFVQNTNLTISTIKKLKNKEDFNSIAEYLVVYLGTDTGRFNLILNDVVVFADGENAIDFYKQYSHKYAKSHNKEALDREIARKRAAYESESEQEKGE